MKAENGAQLGRYEPPAEKCPGCGIIDGCDCYKVCCEVCGLTVYIAPWDNEASCEGCGELVTRP